MKISERLIEGLSTVNFDCDKVLDIINDRIEIIGMLNEISAVECEYYGKSFSVTFESFDGEELEVHFEVEIEDGETIAYAEVEHDEEDENGYDIRTIRLPELVPVIQTGEKDFMVNPYDFNWLDLDALLDIVEGDDYEDFDEAFTHVIRDGKRVKKKLVRAKRRKRMSAKQKQGIRKAVRKRKSKKSQTNRKRKKSLKIRKRKNLKRNTSKRLKVQGTSTRKRR